MYQQKFLSKRLRFGCSVEQMRWFQWNLEFPGSYQCDHRPSYAFPFRPPSPGVSCRCLFQAPFGAPLGPCSGLGNSFPHQDLSRPVPLHHHPYYDYWVLHTPPLIPHCAFRVAPWVETLPAFSPLVGCWRLRTLLLYPGPSSFPSCPSSSCFSSPAVNATHNHLLQAIHLHPTGALGDLL